jgi:hypothetical protein
MGRYLRTSIGLVALALLGCSERDAQSTHVAGTVIDSSGTHSNIIHERDSIEIRFGSSFGMCVEYCKSEYELHSWGLECTRVGWDTAAFPEQRQIAPVVASKYQAILNAVYTTSLWSEFSVRQMGCPDRADGGRCWVEVRQGGALKRFDYDCIGGPGPYSGLADLVTSVAKGVRWWEPGEVYVPIEFVLGGDRSR